MKKVVNLLLCAAAMCVMLLSTSCNGVSQESITQKVTEAKGEMPNFTEDEYEFMANYLSDNAEKMNKIESIDEFCKDGEFYILCMSFLADAKNEGKLSKSVLEKYNKVMEQTLSGGESTTTTTTVTEPSMRSTAELTNEELIAEYTQLADELVNEYKSTGSIDQKKMERFIELQLCAYSEKDMSSDEIAQIDAIANAYTEAMAE